MELRLFPLRTVLFPGMPLSLRVFEDRYRQLVSECIDASDPFGVALIREGEEAGADPIPYDLGTTARIDSVRPDARGRLQLQATGERRFRIADLHHDRPYLWADVEYPLDEEVDVPNSTIERARERYAALVRLRMAAGGEYAREVPSPPTAGALADAAGAQLPAPPGALQRLLETMDVRLRLERALEMLDAVLPAAERQARVAVARRYGGYAALN